MTYKLMCLVGR